MCILQPCQLLHDAAQILSLSQHIRCSCVWLLFSVRIFVRAGHHQHCEPHLTPVQYLPIQTISCGSGTALFFLYLPNMCAPSCMSISDNWLKSIPGFSYFSKQNNFSYSCCSIRAGLNANNILTYSQIGLLHCQIFIMQLWCTIEQFYSHMYEKI